MSKREWWFPFEPRRFASDDCVMGMDLESVGAHILLMCATATSPERYRMDTDEIRIRNVCRNPSEEKWQRIKAQLFGKAWKLSADGQWWEQEGLRQTFEKKEKTSKDQRERVNKRWGNKDTYSIPDEYRTDTKPDTEVIPNNNNNSNKSMYVGPSDPESRILNLVQAHPKGKRYDDFEEVPLVAKQAAIDAIDREAKKQGISQHDAYLFLLKKTKLYDNYVSQWPKPEQGKCYRLEDWFNRKGYNDEPETWERTNGEQKPGPQTVNLARAGAGIVRAINNVSAAQTAIQVLRDRRARGGSDGGNPTGEPD